MANKSAPAQRRPNPKKDLALLFAVPLGIVLLAVTAVYVPQLLARPQTSFVYSYCDQYDCEDYYSVDAGGQLTHRFNNSDRYYDTKGITSLFLYDPKTDTSRRLSAEEVQKLALNTNSRSPDGYTLNREDSESGFLFWGERDSGWYLQDGFKKKQITIQHNTSYYSNNLKFLGWTK